MLVREMASICLVPTEGPMYLYPDGESTLVLSTSHAVSLDGNEPSISWSIGKCLTTTPPRHSWILYIEIKTDKYFEFKWLIVSISSLCYIRVSESPRKQEQLLVMEKKQNIHLLEYRYHLGLQRFVFQTICPLKYRSIEIIFVEYTLFM